MAEPATATEQNEARRIEMLRAAAELICERGFGDTRIADVARRAGVSSALVIYYFGTRDRLLVDALRYSEESFYEAAEKMLAEVPSLRERLSDVSLLADHFLKRFVRETGRKVRGFTPAAMQKLQTYNWPGNVRELRNVIERSVALSTGQTLDAPDIWLSSLDLAGPAPAPAPLEPVYEPLSIEEIEKRHILKTLEHTDWNKSQAANILQIERSTLDRKIKHYDLKRL